MVGEEGSWGRNGYSRYVDLVPGPLILPDLVSFPLLAGQFTVDTFAGLTVMEVGERVPVIVCLGRHPGKCAAVLGIRPSGGGRRWPTTPRAGQVLAVRPLRSLALTSAACRACNPG